MTPIVDCEQLEAYLDGDLSVDEIAAFQAHLSLCEDCRSAKGQQQWIEGLLHSPQLAALEPAPAQMLTMLSVAVSRRRRRRAILASGLAAAVLAVVATWGIANRQAKSDALALVVPVPAAALQASISPAVFVADDSSIAVPVATEYPDVTIVRVYAAYRPDPAPSTAPAIAPDSNKDISLEPFNGG